MLSRIKEERLNAIATPVDPRAFSDELSLVWPAHRRA